jgi:hypothetical protein
MNQLRASNQDNQAVSGDSSILSGNNLQCQYQDSSKFSNPNCDSVITITPSLVHYLQLLITTNEFQARYVIEIDQFDRDNKSLRVRLMKCVIYRISQLYKIWILDNSLQIVISNIDQSPST